jgi:phosphate transport system substrate-binding protein
VAGLSGLLLVSSPDFSKAAQPDALIAGGTGSGLEIIRLLVDAYSRNTPGQKITVLPSLGSGGGIKAVLKGKLSFSVSARALKDKEKAAGASAVEIAKSPMGFFTRQDNPATEVDIELLTMVYSGQPAVWPDGTPVRVVMRPLKETDTNLLRTLSKEIDQGIADMVSHGKAVIAVNDQKNAEALEKVPGSLGFAAYGQIVSEKRKLKALVFRGRQEPLADMKAGGYPFIKTLRLVSMVDPDPAVSAFLKFVGSADGAKVLEKNGFVAVSAAGDK